MALEETCLRNLFGISTQTTEQWNDVQNILFLVTEKSSEQKNFVTDMKRIKYK